MLMVRCSSLPRVFACPGSLTLGAQAPTSLETEAAREGTAAHELAKMVLTGAVSHVDELIDRRASNGVVYTAEMADHTAQYIEHLQTRGLPLTVEESGQFSLTHATVTGTPDCIAYDATANRLYIDDFKYGFRHVEARENWQLIGYALLVCVNMSLRPSEIILTIHQPRSYHSEGTIREWSINNDQLQHYFQQLDAALTAAAHSTTIQTGPHCYKCPAATICPANQKAGMAALEYALESVYSDELTGGALATELDNLRRAQEIVKDRLTALEELAIDRVKKGATNAPPGYILETRLGNRKWLDTVNADMFNMLTGVLIEVPKLMTPAQAERAGADKATVAAFTERLPIGHKLRRVDIDAKAREIFKNG